MSVHTNSETWRVSISNNTSGGLPTLGVTCSTTLREVTETLVGSPEHAVTQLNRGSPSQLEDRHILKSVPSQIKWPATFLPTMISDLPPCHGPYHPCLVCNCPHDQQSSYHLPVLDTMTLPHTAHCQHHSSSSADLNPHDDDHPNYRFNSQLKKGVCVVKSTCNPSPPSHQS